MADYCKKTFGISLSDLKEGDLIKFFSIERTESDTLEFKSFPGNGKVEAEVNAVLEPIAGMLNSGGGLVIWGAPKSIEKKKKEKVVVGAVTPVVDLKGKDWFVSKISYNITPMPIGIRVEVIEVGGGCVCVIEVEESIQKPHQFDGKYPVRLDGAKSAAPHWLVQAMFRQISFPNIICTCIFQSVEHIGDKAVIHFAVSATNLSHFQNEENFSFTIQSVWGTINGNSSYESRLFHVLHAYKPLYLPLTMEVTDFKNKSVGDLNLEFGGRFSPAKRSYYRVNLRLQTRGETAFNMAEIVSVQCENTLLMPDP